MSTTGLFVLIIVLFQSVLLSVCTPFCLSSCLFLFLSVSALVCLSFCLFVILSVCYFVYLSFCLFVFLSVCYFVCLYSCLFECLSICLSSCLFHPHCFYFCSFVILFICTPVYLSYCLFVLLSVCHSVCLSFCLFVFCLNKSICHVSYCHFLLLDCLKVKFGCKKGHDIGWDSPRHKFKDLTLSKSNFGELQPRLLRQDVGLQKKDVLQKLKFRERKWWFFLIGRVTSRTWVVKLTLLQYSLYNTSRLDHFVKNILFLV